MNDWKKVGYGGALYALDCTLRDLEHPTKAKLEKAMDGHVLAPAELVGTFKKGHE